MSRNIVAMSRFRWHAWNPPAPVLYFVCDNEEVALVQE